MFGEVDWIAGYPKRVEKMGFEEFASSVRKSEVVYGGFLWSDLEPEGFLESFHPRLILDFRVGWSAVGFPSRGPVDLGPWSAPATARANSAAPFGLYLLSAQRLRQSLPGGEQSRAPAGRVHHAQQSLGRFFCDPNLEVSFSTPRDLAYRPPSIQERVRSVYRFLSGGIGF
ncbi:MAG: hypothetical protein WC423_18515 [Vulcanimicrobiota bacterium]